MPEQAPLRSAHDGRPRHLCIAIDDYGLHQGICQAALLLAAAGRVQAIGCMVGGAAWPRWSRALAQLQGNRAHRHGIDLGLHLDLTEAPCKPEAARPLSWLMLDCWSHCIHRPRLRAEIRRQLDAFEQALGRAPDYVDGHQHVHQFPVVRTELLEELRHRYGHQLPWLRSTCRPGPAARQGFGFKPWLIETLGARALGKAARRAGFAQNRALLGVHDFSTDAAAYSALLRHWLANAGDSDLLMCHPSLVVDGRDPILNARMAEFEVLSGADFGRWLDEAGIVLRALSRTLASAGFKQPH